jgi:hypothetical protein
MKRIHLLIAVFFAVVLSGCSNNKDEKRIAELESRLADLETKNTPYAPANVQSEPEAKPEGPLPAFTFEKTSHDFGTIKEGDVVEHVFKFKNTGDAPLIIQNATGSCGCTVPTYSKESIAPGETGEIVAEFNSQGRQNLQNKTVTVTANTWPKQTMLKIRAMVTPKAQAENTDGPVRK